MILTTWPANLRMAGFFVHKNDRFNWLRLQLKTVCTMLFTQHKTTGVSDDYAIHR
jgi:hypothetical protein